MRDPDHWSKRQRALATFPRLVSDRHAEIKTSSLKFIKAGPGWWVQDDLWIKPKELLTLFTLTQCWQKKAMTCPKISFGEPLPNINLQDILDFLCSYLKDILATDFQFWFSLSTFIQLASTWCWHMIMISLLFHLILLFTIKLDLSTSKPFRYYKAKRFTFLLKSSKDYYGLGVISPHQYTHSSLNIMSCKHHKPKVFTTIFFQS